MDSSSISPVPNAQRWINCSELAFGKQIPLRSTKTECGQQTGPTGAKSTCSRQFMMHKWVNRSRVRSSIGSCYTSACWWPRTRQLKRSILQNYHPLPVCSFPTSRARYVYLRADTYRLYLYEHTEEAGSAAPTHIWSGGRRAPRSACRTAGWCPCCCCTQTRCSGAGGTRPPWSLPSAPPCSQAWYLQYLGRVL